MTSHADVADAVATTTTNTTTTTATAMASKPPALCTFQAPPRGTTPPRQHSFSSLDADDEGDGDTVPARLFPALTSSTHDSPRASRHTLKSRMKERERADKHISDTDDDDERDESDQEDDREHRSAPQLGERETEWRRCPAAAAASAAAASANTATGTTRSTAATTTTATPNATMASGASAPSADVANGRLSKVPVMEELEESETQVRPPPALASLGTPPYSASASSSMRVRHTWDESGLSSRSNRNASLAASAMAAATDAEARSHEEEVVKEAERRELLRSKMQEFGCCVLFFPTPMVSWLFPMTGNVAITNAEGSRLYTFESSYYVREEKLQNVLDALLAEDDSFAGLLDAPKPPPMPRRVAASPVGSFIQPSSDGYVTSPLMGPHLPFGGGSPVQQVPPRKTKQATSKGHGHARCVRIWDLKPLLMEARSRRRPQGNGRADGASPPHRSGPAAALWHLLRQELNNAVYSNGMTSDSDYGSGRRRAEGRSGSSGGVTEDDDETYEFLDAATARMFNRNLQASIKIFRGSPHGGSTQSERLLEELNSFSFVCFVLEACGVGGWASPAPRAARGRKLPPPLTRKATSPPPQATNGATSATTPTANAASKSPGESDDSDDDDSGTSGTSWGFIKLCIHLCAFGKWYRCGGRARRVLHGGSFTAAVLLWALLLAFLFYYLFPPHQWGVLVSMAQNVGRGVWMSWMNQTTDNSNVLPASPPE